MDSAPLPAPPWRLNLLLFLATVASVFTTALLSDRAADEAVARASGLVGKLSAPFVTGVAVFHAVEFTLSLLGILTAHELGHFIASRIHRVDASLPFFIPMPMLSPFGTMGAVIRMRGVIPTRSALLDIGASGPLAGLALALPLYFYGARQSTFVSLVPSAERVELGESLIVKLIDHLAQPSLPADMELYLSPVAFGAWAGMFVTMINLLPVGQLDGGHVAYALLGPKQDRLARVVHRGMLGLFFFRLAQLQLVDLRVGLGLSRFGVHVGNALFWFVWFEMLAVLGALSRPARGQSPEGVRAAHGGAPLALRSRIAWTLALVLTSGMLRTPADLPRALSPIGLVPLWIAWFAGLFGLLLIEQRRGALREITLLDHPPTAQAPLGPGRALVAIVTLLFFVGLFMPTPIAM